MGGSCSLRQSVKVMLVDDHPVVFAGLRMLFSGNAGFEVVAEARGEEAALAEFRRQQPDVVMMDLRLRKRCGIMVARRILGISPEARILIFTGSDAEQDISRAFEAGALGYLLKDSSPAEYFEAVRLVSEGRKYLSPHISKLLGMAREAPKLTGRETEVLRALASGLSNREIARTIGRGEETVKAHLRAIFGKIGATNRTEAVALATKRGFISLD